MASSKILNMARFGHLILDGLKDTTSVPKIKAFFLCKAKPSKV
jgi:hypothetical protein